MRRFILIVLVLAVAAGAFYWLKPPRNGGSEGRPIAEAIAAGEASASITANDATQARITVSRGSSARGTLVVTIPAGTPIFTATSGGQRLLTARAVTVRLDDQTPQQTVAVETYCLDQFALEPTEVDSLSLQPGDGGMTLGEETEPVLKLADCLEDSQEPRAQRQFAIWMVAGSYLDMSYGQARDSIRRKYRQTLEEQSKAMMQGTVRADLQRAMPTLSESQLDEHLARYTRDSLGSKLDARAEQMTDQDLAGFVSRGARAALDACGHETAGLAFFKDAPV